MSKIRVISLIMAAMSLFSSCEKISNQYTQIQGLSVNLTDGSPLVGYPIHLVETEESPEPFGPVTRKIIESTTTDGNGEFMFESELMRQDRYQYTVEFDDLGRGFFSNTWQDDEYDEVAGVIPVEKGEWNTCLIKQVPTFSLNVLAKNVNHQYPLLFDAIYHSSLYEHQVLYRTLSINEERMDNNFINYPAGNFEIEWRISDEFGFSDTIVQSYQTQHDERLEIRLDYED